MAWGREWQATLAADRWVGVHWPSAYGGRSATPVQVALYQSEYARSQAPQPVNRVGINLVGPTLLAHGTEDQRLRYLPPILSAAEIWCQLFSEPDAGSDLASLSTRAVPTDGGYLVTGRKVWTSYAQFASWGLCLARTDPDGPRRQQGITALIVDMSDPGVDVRPLVQMTGDAEFNEVFLTDVFVPAEQVVGTEGQGWTVAGSTLAHERGTNFPFKEQVVHETYLARLYEEARRNGALDDPLVVRRAGAGLHRSGRPPSPQPAHADAPGARRGTGSRVELDQAHVDRHDAGLVRGGAAGDGTRPRVGRRRTVGAPVAVEQGGRHRRRDVAGAARHHRGKDPGPTPLTAARLTSRRLAPERTVRCRTKNTVTRVPTARPTSSVAMSCGESWPVKIRPIPYELAATETEKAKDASKIPQDELSVLHLGRARDDGRREEHRHAAPPGVGPLPALASIRWRPPGALPGRSRSSRPQRFPMA